MSQCPRCGVGRPAPVPIGKDPPPPFGAREGDRPKRRATKLEGHDSSGRGAAARPDPGRGACTRRGALAPGAGADRRRIRGRRQDPGPGPQPPRAGPVRRDVERALLVQVLPAAPAPPPHRGAAGPGGSRRERGGHRRRRRHRRGHPDREPQPPLGDRALPGRRHRGGRHSARHLHHGGASPRRDGPALLRLVPTTPASAGSSRASSAGSRATATPSGCRRWAGS